jgi:hypothetical protein
VLACCSCPANTHLQSLSESLNILHSGPLSVLLQPPTPTLNPRNPPAFFNPET